HPLLLDLGGFCRIGCHGCFRFSRALLVGAGRLLSRASPHSQPRKKYYVLTKPSVNGIILPEESNRLTSHARPSLSRHRHGWPLRPRQASFQALAAALRR